MAQPISPLRERANAYKLEIDKLREKVVGSSQSMASKISTFDKIMLERILASKALEGAILHYENARQEAQQQQLYLQTIVDPNLPDQALYPKRFISLIFIFMLCFAVFLDREGVRHDSQRASSLNTSSPGSLVSSKIRSSPWVGHAQANGPRSIGLTNVTKEYHTAIGTRRILDGVSFDVKAGEKIAVLGKNGAGKSTLVKIVGGAEPPTSGEVRRGLFMSWPIAFAGGFEATMSGLDNIRFISRLYGVPIQDTIEFVDDFAELGRQLLLPVKTYSTGMRARLAFALTLAIDFECFLIDEVLSVGDARFHQRCYDALFVKRAHCAMILVSHDVAILRRYCHKALVLKAGRGRVFDDVELALNIYSSL